MARKILIGMAGFAIVGALFSAGYRYGQSLARQAQAPIAGSERPAA